MRRALTAALVCAALLSPSTSSGHKVSLTDPNDTAGKLDIKRMSVGHGSVAFRMVFRNDLRRRYFRDGSALWIFDNRGREVFDHLVTVQLQPLPNHPRRSRLYCLAYDTGPPTKYLGKVGADIDGPELKCLIPNRMVDRMPRWVDGQSSYNDHVDDTRRLNH